jgi:hypothetical protein
MGLDCTPKILEWTLEESLYIEYHLYVCKVVVSLVETLHRLWYLVSLTFWS